MRDRRNAVRTTLEEPTATAVQIGMEISIREAAPLLGRSERAVRAKILRGELPARRQGRTWRIPLATLPLTAEQRDSLQQRGDAARQALEAVLPSRLPHDHRHSSRSVADLMPFARSNALLRQLAQVEPQCHDARRAQRWLRRAMLLLSAAAVEFAPTHRISALRRARFGLGHVVGLLLSSGSVPVAAVQASVSLLENEVLPPIGGLLRQAERRLR